MTAFFREERAHLEAKLEQQEAKLEQQRQETELQRRETEQQRQENMNLREQALEAKLATAVGSKVDALQSRVQALHSTQLLADEELYSLEDIIADAADGEGDDERVAKMIALSERMAADGSFARQLRRKFV